jgi:hypothetical protein
MKIIASGKSAVVYEQLVSHHHGNTVLFVKNVALASIRLNRPAPSPFIFFDHDSYARSAAFFFRDFSELTIYFSKPLAIRGTRCSLGQRCS